MEQIVQQNECEATYAVQQIFPLSRRPGAVQVLYHNERNSLDQTQIYILGFEVRCELAPSGRIKFHEAPFSQFSCRKRNTPHRMVANGTRNRQYLLEMTSWQG